MGLILLLGCAGATAYGAPAVEPRLPLVLEFDGAEGQRVHVAYQLLTRGQGIQVFELPPEVSQLPMFGTCRLQISLPATAAGPSVGARACVAEVRLVLSDGR